MQTSRHIVVAQPFHGELNRTLQMVINGIFSAVCIDNHFIIECSVSAFTDILRNRWEQPQGIVCPIGRVSGFLDIFRIIRCIFMTSIVIELDQRQTTAIVYLCRQHKPNLFCCKFWVEVNNPLNILYGIPITIAVPQTAINERGCSRPDKGDETLISVPNVNHIIKGFGWRFYREMIQLFMPELLKGCNFFIHFSSGFIGMQDFICFCTGLATQYENQFLGFARLQSQFCLQCTAGIGVIVQFIVTMSAFHGNWIGIRPIRANKVL